MKEDDALLQFLHTYRREAPLPNPELEDKIICQLHRPSGFPLDKILIAIVLLGGGLFGFARFRQWQMAQTQLNLDTLEASLIQSWEVATARVESEDSLSYLFSYKEDK
ncbi:MAG: hypothetical protein ACK421_04410 [Pseudanabaenaceae cyanobacterium]